MSNSLDPDQARHFLGPDLGTNCLKKLSADGTPDHVTIMIICLLYAFFLTFSLILKPVLVFNPEKLRERLP